jgi:hypothetical protein
MKSLRAGLQSESSEKFLKILTERFKIFVDKNRDYGSSFKVDGIVGIIIRLGDKLKRLKTIEKNGYRITVKEEGLKELLLDIGNYADMGIMLLEDAKDEGAVDSSNEPKFVC